MLEQLENNEAVLLMYLSGELPDEDRVEVEQLLATDAKLRQLCDEMRATLADGNAVINMVDTKSRLPVRQDVAVRNTLRAIRQWRLFKPETVAAEQKKGLRYPWWVYPMSSAAVLLLAGIVWWGYRPELPDPSIANRTPASTQFRTPSVDGQDDEDRAEYAQIDSLDQAYLELRHIQEMSSEDGM